MAFLANMITVKKCALGKGPLLVHGLHFDCGLSHHSVPFQSVDKFFGGHFVWMIMCVIASMGYVSAGMLLELSRISELVEGLYLHVCFSERTKSQAYVGHAARI